MLVKNSFEFDARVERAAQALRADGWRVRIVSIHDGGRLPLYEVRDGVEVIRVRRLYGRFARYAPESTVAPSAMVDHCGSDVQGQWWRRLCRWTMRSVFPAARLANTAVIDRRMARAAAVWRPELVYANDLNTLRVGVRTAKSTGGTLIYDSHELHTHRAGDGRLARDLAWLRERQLIGSAAAVITSSDAYADYLTGRYRIARPTVVRNVPDSDPVTEPIDLHQQLRLDTSRHLLLYQGSVQPGRGLAQAVAALDLLPSWDLVVIGYGAYKPGLQRLAAQRAVGDRVHFIGPVPHRELLHWSAGADVGLCLIQDHGVSYRWSMPNKLFEYALARLPVVASNFGEIRRWVCQGERGAVCDPEDPTGIANAVQRAAAIPQGQLAPPQWSTEQKSLIHRVGVATQVGHKRSEPARPTVLIIASNGVGAGHLTRAASVARRLVERSARPFVATMSDAVSLLDRDEIPYEIIPPRSRTGASKRAWNRSLRERICLLLNAHSPDVVAFDGTWPYEGLIEAKIDHKGAHWVWLRRGMWRSEVGPGSIDLTRWFDEVIEPEDFAAARDRGATRADEQSRVVPPVVHHRYSELLDRETARLRLGLPTEGVCALVTLGAGVIGDVTAASDAVLDTLANREGVVMAVTAPNMAEKEQREADNIRVLRARPIAPYLAAFDFAISAAGYNSVHELLSVGVPSLLLPNPMTAVDDQVGRAAWAADAGVALCAASDDPVEVSEAVQLLLDPKVRRELSKNCRGLPPAVGAAVIADRLIEWANK